MVTRDICDCHMHILDRRFPLWSGAVLNPPDAMPEDYRKVRDAIGIARCVVAGPSIYGADNRCTMEAIRSIGIPAKGTAILTKDSSTADIARLNEAGFVAARFNFIQGGPWKVEDLPGIARRVADFGWHVQIYANPKLVVDMASLLWALPTAVVFEHVSEIRDPHGADAQAYRTIVELAERGRAWAKLSAPYLRAEAGSDQGRRFATTVSAFVGAIPQRLVWASDWPHATSKNPLDTQRMFTEFCSFVGDDESLEQILVENPRRLYGFA